MTLGVWSRAFRRLAPDRLADVAAELESLGYTTIWIPGETGGDVLDTVGAALAATSRARVATGVLNIWMHEPADVAAAHDALLARFPGRAVLGLGVSHGPAVERYTAPLRAMTTFLDGLDAASDVAKPADRVLGALGPRMLELARSRTGGAHPYLVTPAHTARARELLGPDAWLAPEQKVLPETDPDRARELIRGRLAYLFALPNYRNNLLRQGFTDADLEGGGSDRLVDALVLWGGPDRIAAGLAAHRAAGADEVALHVLTPDPAEAPLEQWRRLAALGTT
ncbi:TIGR03620 family F420-dependent LLM class oxidoreductase [Dactylosporangium sp. CA-092794]|uniref:TIGR03620 family F420-dependent LLM class oxidoreductase n=1 Tax=Dactylosporangium sp. CA-092794 TaxID=3239929 RepID=UPI003D8E093C